MGVIDEERVACDYWVNLQLGSAKYVASEVTPVCILANPLGALFYNIGADLERILDEARYGRYHGWKMHEWKATSIVLQRAIEKVLQTRRKQEDSNNNQCNNLCYSHTQVTWVDERLTVAGQSKSEGAPSEGHVPKAYSTSIREWIQKTDCLVYE